MIINKNIFCLLLFTIMTLSASAQCELEAYKLKNDSILREILKLDTLFQVNDSIRYSTLASALNVMQGTKSILIKENLDFLSDSIGKLTEQKICQKKEECLRYSQDSCFSRLIGKYDLLDSIYKSYQYGVKCLDSIYSKDSIQKAQTLISSLSINLNVVQKGEFDALGMKLKKYKYAVSLFQEIISQYREKVEISRSDKDTEISRLVFESIIKEYDERITILTSGLPWITTEYNKFKEDSEKDPLTSSDVENTILSIEVSI